MDHAFDIVIRCARLRGAFSAHAEIGIKDGRIAAIAPRLDGTAATEIDARGNLVTESFVNPHLHLCKVWTLPMMEEEALQAYQGAVSRPAGPCDQQRPIGRYGKDASDRCCGHGTGVIWTNDDNRTEICG